MSSFFFSVFFENIFVLLLELSPPPQKKKIISWTAFSIIHTFFLCHKRLLCTSYSWVAPFLWELALCWESTWLCRCQLWKVRCTGEHLCSWELKMSWVAEKNTSCSFSWNWMLSSELGTDQEQNEETRHSVSQTSWSTAFFTLGLSSDSCLFHEIAVRKQ